MIGGFIYGLVVARNGLLMHDMGHRGFKKSKVLFFSTFFFKAFFCDMRLDKLIHCYFFAVGITGSATFWNNQHNKHHAATQVLSLI